MGVADAFMDHRHHREAVARLRRAKHREEKPLATMYPDMATLAADWPTARAELERAIRIQRSLVAAFPNSPARRGADAALTVELSLEELVAGGTLPLQIAAPPCWPSARRQ